MHNHLRQVTSGTNMNITREDVNCDTEVTAPRALSLAAVATGNIAFYRSCELSSTILTRAADVRIWKERFLTPNFVRGASYVTDRITVLYVNIFEY